ncbi:MAG: hypothetical protein WC628_10090, partial [Candidatus Omnitrophota bacterium]
MKKNLSFLVFFFALSASLFFLGEKIVRSGVNSPIALASEIPTVSLNINGLEERVTIPQNSSFVLTWNSTNAAFCYAYGDWTGEMTLAGSKTIPGVNFNKEYRLVCGGHYTRELAVVSIALVVSMNGNGFDGEISPVKQLPLVIERITVIIFWFVSALTILMLLIASYHLITSSGDPVRLDRAKK